MKNVLIVEDDFSIADLLQTALEADGYYVTGIARTVAEALKAAEQHLPDFAVVDVYLAKGGAWHRRWCASASNEKYRHPVFNRE